MTLIRKIETDQDRQSLMFGICSGGQRLGMRLVAEGVETVEAIAALSAANVDLMQGYVFARPQIGQLAVPGLDVEEQVRRVLSGMDYSAERGDLRGAAVGAARPFAAPQHV